MKNIKNLLMSKAILVFPLLLLQIGWLIFAFRKLQEQGHWVSLILSALSILMFLAVLMSRQNPSYQIGWIVIIGAVPLFGGLLYLLFGNKRPAKRLRERLAESKRELSYLQHDSVDPPELSARDKGLSNYVLGTGSYPLSDQTKVTYFPLGEKMFESMLEDLRRAERYIFFEYFIVGDGKMWREIKSILLEKAKAGLDVRVMYDEVGSLPVLPQGFRKELEQAGVKVLNFNPLVPLLSLVMNNRDHRKILVIDGKVGYTGGINIADEYINEDSPYGHWKDTGLRLEGKAAWTLTTMYLELWLSSVNDSLDYDEYRPASTGEFINEGYAQPFSDSPLGQEAVGVNLYLDLLWQAEDYVYIFTPYLIIDYEMIEALTMASKRGVDVRIVVPGIPDKKLVYEMTQSYFKPLLEDGVKIYVYTPGFLHAKSYLSDDKRAVVGTINMDYRSLYLHFECGVLLLDTPCLHDLKHDYQEVFKLSREVTLEDLTENIFVKLKRASLRVVSTLF